MIHIVVALPCEADPFVSRYRLTKTATATAFRLYQGDHMRVIVSGIGKTAAAAATAYLHALTGSRADVPWLNIGIAGHAEQTLGTGLLAHKIIDHASGRCWYPPLVTESPCRSDTVLTVDRPARHYETDYLYDMEAAGFYGTACRLVSAELVQCYKVVSDNRQSPSENVNKTLARGLIADRIGEIDTLIAALGELAGQMSDSIADPKDYAGILARWRFSVYQQNQLRRLLQRWQALAPTRDIWDGGLRSLKTGEQVLAFLQAHLDAIPVRYDAAV